MRSHARVVIIGGGAVGAACLYHLAEAGVADCLLIEKNELTSGSTWHAAGNIPTYAGSWLGMRAGNYAWSLYKDLGDKVDSPITYRHTGAFWPAHTEDRMDLYRHLVGISTSAGFDLDLITPQDMEAMHPYYIPGDGVIGGIHDPYEGDIDPSQLTQALAKGARMKGAAVARFTEVTAISRTGSGEWLIDTNKGQVTCEVVVNATGFHGSALARRAGCDVPVVTLEHQYLVTESVPALEENTALFPLIRDPDIRFYLRRERSGFLFGSYGHPGRLAFREGIPDDFIHGLFPDSVDDIADVLEATLVHVPLLGEVGVQRFVNGPIGYSPDSLPLCGPAAGLPNFYHACGIQVGITQSAAVGKAITEWVTEGETEWDMSAWDPRRFGDWASKDYAEQRVVQLYDYQYAIPFPHRLLPSGRPVQQTPLYETLAAKGAQFGQIGGWERALWFDRGGHGYDESRLSFRDHEPWRDAVRIECESVRDAVGVMDHGGFTKYHVSGAGAEAFLNQVMCGAAPKKGRVKLSYMLTPKGRIWSEATIANLGDGTYLLCGPTLAVDRDFDWLMAQCPGDGSVQIEKGYHHDAALMVMGPQSRVLLSRITDADLSKDAMPWMSVAALTVAGKPVTAMRVSFVGELGWELHMASSDLEAVYAALCDHGDDLGLVDFGSYALNVMRVEKGYHGWGADFGTEYTLYDAGLEGFVNWNKGAFTGSDAVRDQSGRDPEWAFLGFVVDCDDADPLPSDPIFQNGEMVGYVTSACEGFRLGKRLALGYVKAQDITADDNAFQIRVLGQSCPAQSVAMPFYDPQNLRLKG
ncbi:MAG: GcvT family protein [Candidatus Puniceispirillales bacterium]